MYGNPLSLISYSNIRYIGILKDVNEIEQTISLENVRSMGTEGRQGDPTKEIPASNDVYEFIQFRASDVKNVQFESEATQPQPQPAVPNDPAILEARAKPASGQSYPQQQQQPVAQAAPAAHADRTTRPSYQAQAAPAVQQETAEEAITDTESVTDTNERQRGGHQRRQGGYNNSTYNSRGGLNNRGGRGGYNYNNNNRGGYNNRGGRGGYNARGNRRVEIPESDFDFESSNSKLNKEDLAKEFAKLNVHVAEGTSDAVTSGSNTTAATASEGGQAESVTPSYMPKKSFFDDISCEAKERMQMQQQGLSYEERRGRAQAERSQNFETFGQASSDQNRLRYSRYNNGGRGGGANGNPNWRGGHGGGGRGGYYRGGGNNTGGYRGGYSSGGYRNQYNNTGNGDSFQQNTESTA
ncbi:hypothetical protein GGI15_002581 [Coemansia interrupta]|uniref:Uncharacterized protein n=1 Tax=Coemansia interrupta TaxID=1126814 RepID=A0A9W8LL65_9FUNG|nr:hypothetical protein GGI15_002581 [Coemansia interrupta]